MITRARAGRIAARILITGVPALLLVAGLPRLAFAHAGEDESLAHMILDATQWGLGVAAVIGLVVALLWIRVKLRGRGG